jgi:two-component system CheB/CheR fusion protein
MVHPSLLEAHVIQNRTQLATKTVDMCTVAKDAADAVRSLMDARELHFAAEIDEGPLWVAGDTHDLRQIQVDLLNNAAKYTSRGGHVKMQVCREDGHVIVRVTDDGVGIADGMLENMFDFFVHSRRSSDRAEGGLARVRSLVTLHGGEVTAKSEGAGRGAELSVRLPLVAQDSSTPRASTARRTGTMPENAKIVVVEDSVDSCMMLCELLSLAGFSCEPAHDGRTGLELILNTHPDAAIIDVGLPEMDGFELARRLRADPTGSDVFLVALTGYGQPADRERALESGFDEHLVKPVHPDKLLRLLGREGLRGGSAERPHP